MLAVYVCCRCRAVTKPLSNGTTVREMIVEFSCSVAYTCALGRLQASSRYSSCRMDALIYLVIGDRLIANI